MPHIIPTSVSEPLRSHYQSISCARGCHTVRQRFEVCFPEITVVAHKIEHNIRSFNADAPNTAQQCVCTVVRKCHCVPHYGYAVKCTLKYNKFMVGCAFGGRLGVGWV